LRKALQETFPAFASASAVDFKSAERTNTETAEDSEDEKEEKEVEKNG